MSSDLCRFCKAPLEYVFCDLGMSPLSNAFISAAQLARMEPFYPLRTYVCEACGLVQTQDFTRPEAIFNDEYAYYSSYSESWLRHAKKYADAMVQRFGLHAGTPVIEIASNDGYLLQYFKEQAIPVLGVEPASNVAGVAQAAGIPTLVEFFGAASAARMVQCGHRAALLVGNNVLAHVPDINDFVAGLKILLAADGVITLEFPHLARLIEKNQFDTIYHEHFSYFSFTTAEKIFARHELVLFDVDELETHGGSLRIYARHAQDTSKAISPRCARLKESEARLGLNNIKTYVSFSEKVRASKRKLLDFLISAKRKGKSIAGYGAPAKGNTLLNYCGVRSDFIDYTVDSNPHKQGLFLPGTHIPIYAPDKIAETRPDYLLILPWNLRQEITGQMASIRAWGGRFVVPIPELEIIE